MSNQLADSIINSLERSSIKMPSEKTKRFWRLDMFKKSKME